MVVIVREISRLERASVAEHFLAFGADDRRLRFGVPLNDGALRAYVARMDFENDAAFGVFGESLRLAGVGHLARGEGHAELGISVLPGYRGLRIGSALLARAHLHARNWGVRALFMHCLAENAAMMRLAKRQGMDIRTEADEADAWLALPPADAASYFGAAFEQRVAVFDYALKQGRAWLGPER